jgi:hypothetical protein
MSVPSQRIPHAGSLVDPVHELRTGRALEVTGAPETGEHVPALPGRLHAPH